MNHNILRFAIPLLLLLIFSASKTGTAGEFVPDDTNYIHADVVCQIESGCRNLIGDFGRSIGPYQIQEAVVIDFNKANGERYSHGDMRDFQKSGRVAEWYLNTEIPRLLNHYGIKDTVNNRIIAYNAGIRRAIKVSGGAAIPEVTKKYIVKYAELTHGR